MKRVKIFALILAMSIIPTLLVWTPFYLGMDKVWGIPLPQGGMQVVASNYDGPLYIVVAKTFYERQAILTHFSFPLPYEYYAAHFPLYPAIIRLIGVVTGNVWGMLIATLVGNVVATSYFFAFIKRYAKTDADSLWITLVFSLFPARWLIVKSVGAPETLFVGTIIASMYYFQKKNYLMAGLFGALAQLTKSPGILLFIVYGLALTLPQLKKLALTKSFKKWFIEINYNALFLGLIPAALLLVSFIFQKTFGNFFAYFNSGDNIHLFFPPFQIFNYTQPWVNTHWLEEIIFLYLFGAMGLVKLLRKKDMALSCFVAVFFGVTLFISHRDLLRYALPIVPFLYAAYTKTLLKPEFKWVFALLIIPIYLFTLVFISNNIMPVSDWGPLL